MSLLWILLVSVLAKTLLPNRFTLRPRLGLLIWFISLTSSIAAALTALVSLVAAYLSSVELLSVTELGDPSWFAGFALSFVPWIALAGFGVLLALINLRMDSPVILGLKIQQDFQMAKSTFRDFEGVNVFVISVPIDYALATGREIVLSQQLVETLSAEELEAVLWHELGHIKQRHRLLKSIARIVALLSYPLSVSKVFQESVDQLCEQAADLFAEKHCVPEVVERVKKRVRMQS